MKPTKIKPEYYWMVWSPYSGIMPITFGRSENDSISYLLKEITPLRKTWKSFLKSGYRCIEVKLSEVRKK